MNDLIDRFDGAYEFLSNFYVRPMQCLGYVWPTAEHPYHYLKVDQGHPDYQAWQTSIKMAHTPGKAKLLGREAPLRPGWDEIRLDVMLYILRVKFYTTGLAPDLILTGRAGLVEGNYWHDNFWGVCFCSKCGGKGENHLGKLLMQVRSEVHRVLAWEPKTF